jgi:hypothetical protein
MEAGILQQACCIKPSSIACYYAQDIVDIVTTLCLAEVAKLSQVRLLFLCPPKCFLCVMNLMCWC